MEQKNKQALGLKKIKKKKDKYKMESWKQTRE